MRYFLALFAVAVLVVISVAGFRGDRSRRPPIELIADMVRQQKVRPQQGSEFFADRWGSRLALEGTVARGAAVEVAGQWVRPFEDHPFNTGTRPGTTNFVELNPLPVTAELLERGRQRFQITCLPCHGTLGDAKGITTKYGMTVIGNLHDPRIVRLADGEIFNTISNGKNLMQGYGANVDARDRWAIVAYVRALQLSRLATVADLPAEQRAALKK